MYLNSLKRLGEKLPVKRDFPLSIKIFPCCYGHGRFVEIYRYSLNIVEIEFSNDKN